MKKPQPKQGMSSLEAAALLVSNGQTRDPELANHMAEGGTPFDLDALQRAHLRRMMGFDFEVDLDQTKNTIRVYSKEGPQVEETTKYKGMFDESAIDVLVDTCLGVKLKWEAEKLRLEEIKEAEVVEEDNHETD